MNLSLSFHRHQVVRRVIEKELDELGVDYRFNSSSQLELVQDLSGPALCHLKSRLASYGIDIEESQKCQLIQKIKDSITDLIFNDAYYPYTASAVISEKLNLSYGYLSNLFSEYALSTLENYIILQRIERAKSLILGSDHTLTEIAFKLNYSSVGHLSNQFKKVTGLTYTSFIKILTKRNQSIQQQALC